MMNRFCTNILVLFICFGLSACGGGGGDDHTPVAAGTTYSGTAVKGIIVKGIVKAYPIENGAISTTPLDIGVVLTDTKGEYSFTVPAGFSGSIKIEIVASADTTMKCDLPAGCGTDYPFGSPVPLASDFKMSALVPAVVAGSKVNVVVSPMTHIAAALALKRATESPELGLTTDLILNTNSHVTNLFGMTNLLDYAVIDLTDQAALKTAGDAGNNDAIDAALLSAALLGASGDGTMTEALARLTQTVVDNDGQLLLNDADTDISMHDIVQMKMDVLDKAVKNAADKEVTVTVPEMATALTTEEHQLGLKDPASKTDAKPSETAMSEPLAQTKAFASDLRDLVYATTIVPGSETAANKVVIGMDDFTGQLDIAAEASKMAADEMVKALPVALEGISRVIVEDLPSMTTDSATFTKTIKIGWNETTQSQETMDVAVAVTHSNGSYTISVSNSDIFGFNVDLTAVYAGTFTDVVNESTSSTTVKASLGLSGNISNAALKMTITDGSSGSVDIKIVDTNEQVNSNTEYLDKSEESLTMDSLALKLGVTLEQLTGTNPVTFTGALDLALAGVKYYNLDLESGTFNPETNFVKLINSANSELSFETGKMTLSGKFADSQAHFFAATLAINAAGNGFSLIDSSSNTETYTYNPIDGMSNNYTQEQTSDTSAETADKFVSFGFSLQFDAALPGLTEQAQVIITGNRDTLTHGSGTLKLAYEGKRINADVTYNNDDKTGTVVATNQDNVVLTLTLAADKNVSGTMKVDGANYASIIESAGIKTSYSDGTFELY